MSDLWSGPYVHTHPKHGYTAELVEADEAKIQAALTLEKDVWQRMNYGTGDEYRDYDSQSRIFAAFLGETCIGMTRIFKGSPLKPPFMSLPISDDRLREQLAEGCEAGAVEEVGTAATDDERAPALEVAKDLWRLAYRNARANGVETWGIIMEPERVAVMNKWYGFTFEQIGPEQDYQGGMCAAHITDMQGMIDQMLVNRPERYAYFVTDPLNSQS